MRSSLIFLRADDKCQKSWCWSSPVPSCCLGCWSDRLPAACPPLQPVVRGVWWGWWWWSSTYQLFMCSDLVNISHHYQHSKSAGQQSDQIPMRSQIFCFCQYFSLNLFTVIRTYFNLGWFAKQRIRYFGLVGASQLGRYNYAKLI